MTGVPQAALPFCVGMGIGLYSCRQIVESHGGRVRVDSEPGSGTCVEVALPLLSTAASCKRSGVCYTGPDSKLVEEGSDVPKG